MKKTIIAFLTFLALIQLSFADARSEFIEKIKKAFEDGSVATILELHYGGIPKEIKPMFERRWVHEMKPGMPLQVSIQAFDDKGSPYYNQDVSIKDASYIRTAPATEFVVLTWDKTNSKVPITLIDNTYYFASYKKK